jgi:hypothetical protein
MKAERRLTEDDLWEMLIERYPRNAWALFGSVRNTIGYARNERYADAVAMSLWPSRGLHVHGFEIKVSRQDLVRELKDPAKSAAVQSFCDFWWLVLASADLLKPGELPPTWGVLAVRGRKLVQVSEAPKLDAKPIDRPLLASLLRRFQDKAVPREAHQALEASIDRRAEERALQLADAAGTRLHRELSDKLDSLRLEHAALQREVATFEKASGLEIQSWRAGDMGTAVRMLLDAGVVSRRTWTLNALRTLKRELTAVAKQTAELVEGMEEGFPKP